MLEHAALLLIGESDTKPQGRTTAQKLGLADLQSNKSLTEMLYFSNKKAMLRNLIKSIPDDGNSACNIQQNQSLSHHLVPQPLQPARSDCVNRILKTFQITYFSFILLPRLIQSGTTFHTSPEINSPTSGLKWMAVFYLVCFFGSKWFFQGD